MDEHRWEGQGDNACSFPNTSDRARLAEELLRLQLEEMRLLRENLAATQARCTELLEENRRLRQEVVRLR